MSVIKGLGVVIVCFALSMGIAGCSNAANQPSSTSGEQPSASSEQPSTSSEQPSNAEVQGEWVEGIITSVSESELLVEITSDSTGSLTGPVRVGVDSLSAETRAEMREGIVIEVTYSGAVGMSDPPFIPAKDIVIIENR